MFRYTIQMSEDDYVGLYRAIQKNSSESKAGQTRFLLLIGVLVILLLLLPALVRRELPGLSELLVLGLILVIGAVTYFASRALIPRLAVRQLQRNDPAAQTGFVRSFDDTGIHSEGPGSSGSWQWSTIQRALETPEFFLFFVGPTHALFVPKQAMAGPQDQAAFRTFLTDKLGSRFAAAV